LVIIKDMATNNLKALLDDLLLEDNPPPMPATAADIAPVEAPKDVSLDQVIDRYLIRYEKESIPTVDDYEAELHGESVAVPHFMDVVNEAFLTEQEPGEEEEDPLADEAGAEEGDDAGLDLGGDDAGLDLGGDEGDLGAGAEEEGGDAPAASPGEPTVVATPQINLNDFARSVARLVNNFEVLLNPRDTILNRIEAYMVSNYDERTARELMDILDVNYSLRPAQSGVEQQGQEFPTPYAAGALSTD
jgi:hypothetical protein